MKWYAAHVVMFVKLKGKRQNRFPVWENIVLIKAGSESQAMEKAEQRGRLDEGDDDGSFRWKGQPAAWVFAGIRKITSCDDPEARPGDGTEITYSELELDSEKSIADFVVGQQVPVLYNETFAEKDHSDPAKKTSGRRSSA